MDLSPDEMRILKKVLGDFKGSIRGAMAKKMMPKDEGSPEEEAGESPDMEKAEMADGMQADGAANPDMTDATDGSPSDDEMEKLKELYAQLKG